MNFNKSYLFAVIFLIFIITMVLVLKPAKPGECRDKNTESVYECNDGTVLFVSHKEGAGFKALLPDGRELNCPITPQIIPECQILLEQNCPKIIQC